MDFLLSDLPAWQQVMLLVLLPALGILLGRILIDLYKKIIQSTLKTKYLIGTLGFFLLYAAMAYFFGEIGRIIVLVTMVVILLFMMVISWRNM